GLANKAAFFELGVEQGGTPAGAGTKRRALRQGANGLEDSQQRLGRLEVARVQLDSRERQFHHAAPVQRGGPGRFDARQGFASEKEQSRFRETDPRLVWGGQLAGDLRRPVRQRGQCRAAASRSPVVLKRLADSSSMSSSCSFHDSKPPSNSITG